MAKIVFTIFLVFLVANASAMMEEQVTCQDAITSLLPCMEFLKGKGPATPSVPCCLGVQKLNQKCAARPDRVQVCQCLKNASPGLGVVLGRAKSLPALCNIHWPFPIERDIDCNKIQAGVMIMASHLNN